MSRTLDPIFSTSLTAGQFGPVILVSLTFASATRYVWSGVGTLVWNGNSFTGIGSLGKISDISEGTDIQADGVTLTLSGLDPIWLGEALTDIQIGAAATIWFGNMLNGALIGTPYQIFQGTVDRPVVTGSGQTISIALELENRLSNLSRASNRRYTSADQRLYYPTDIAFGWVEQLNDLALNWGG
jgi:hypothetical protein